MKTEIKLATSPAQSQYLISLGVRQHYADYYWSWIEDINNTEGYIYWHVRELYVIGGRPIPQETIPQVVVPAFSLNTLLHLLGEDTTLEYHDGKYYVETPQLIGFAAADQAIDAAYAALTKILKLKNDKENEKANQLHQGNDA